MPEDTLFLEADANDVVNELRRAAKAFKEYNVQVNEAAKVSKTVTEQGNKITRQLTSMDSAGNKFIVTQQKINGQWQTMSKQLKQAAVDQKKLNGLTINYASAVRLVGVQLAHRFIASSVSSIREAASEYTNIATALGEVRTISQSMPRTTAEWFKESRQLSETFGKSVKDEIEATYQALSNQVVQSGDDLHFLASANKFALTAVASTTDAVDLLSSALNSYDVDVTQADAVSAKLFKTIELGRIRASELANTFGSVALISKQTNIEMDELLAFMAALSKQGFKVNEAMTQMRGIIVKILKPTESMKDFFNELGVASGEEALRIHGLVGFLEQLKESTQGSSTELGKMISRIRGLSAGLFGTTEKGLTEIAGALDQIRNSSDSFETAYTEMLTNLGTRTNIQLQKIKNEYLELAAVTVNVFTGTAEAIGGADVAIKILTRSLGVGLVFAAGRAVVALNAVGLAAAKARLVSAIPGGLPTIAAVGTAIAAAAIYTAIEEAAEKAAKAEADARRKAIFDIAKSNSEAKILYEEQIDAQVLETEKLYVQQRKWRADDLDNLKEYYNEALSEVKKFYSFTISEAGDASKEASKAYNQTLSDLEDITKKRRELFRGTRDSIIDTLIGQREGSEKVAAFKEVLKSLEKEQAKAAEEGNKERFDNLAKRRQSLFEESVKFEDKLTENNKKAVEKRAKLERETSQANIEYRRSLELASREDTDLKKAKARASAETKFAKALDKIKEQQEQIRVVEFERTNSIRARLALLQTNLQLLDKLNEKQKEIAKQQLAAKIDTDLSTEKLKSGLKSLTKFKLANALGGDSTALQNSLKEITEAYKDFVDGQKELGIELTRTGDVTDLFGRISKTLGEQQVNRQLEEGRREITTYKDEVLKAADALQDLQAEQSRRSVRGSQALTDLLKALQSNIASYGSLGPVAPGFRAKQIARENFEGAETPEQLIQAAKETAQWTEKNVKDDALRKEILGKLARIQNEMTSQLKTQDQLYNKRQEVLKRELELQKKIREEGEKHLELMKQRTMLNLINSSGGLPEPGNYTGRVYGRDNINTTLSEGESVISSQATRRNYNSLVAINSVPQAAVSGKTVSIGDINVNLNSTGSTKVDARAIALEVKALVKRGVA